MSLDTPSERNIAQPNDDDVLLGRGAACWNHPGNRRFREIVSSHLKDYEAAKARIEKMVIVADIVKKITEAGGRFLKKDERSDTWYTVDRKAAIEKVGHAIRDKRAMVTKKQERDRMAQQIEEQHHANLGLSGMHAGMPNRAMAHLMASGAMQQHRPMPLGGAWPAPAFLPGAGSAGMQGLPSSGGMQGMVPMDGPGMQHGGMPFVGGPLMDPTGGAATGGTGRPHHQRLMEQGRRDLEGRRDMETQDAMSELRRTEMLLEEVRNKAAKAKEALRALEEGGDITNMPGPIDPSATGYSPRGGTTNMHPGQINIQSQPGMAVPPIRQPYTGVQQPAQGGMNPGGMIGLSTQGGGYGDHLRRLSGMAMPQQQTPFNQAQRPNPDGRAATSDEDITAALHVLQKALEEGKDDSVRRATLASGIPPERLLDATRGTSGGMGYAAPGAGGSATRGSSGQEQQWNKPQYPPQQGEGEGGGGFDNNMSNQQGGR